MFSIYRIHFIISSLVIPYSDDYMFGDFSIFLFIMFVVMFVVSIMFLIVSPNVIGFWWRNLNTQGRAWIRLSADRYSAWTCQKTTLISGHYLRNRSTLDIGVLGYIGIL